MSRKNVLKAYKLETAADLSANFETTPVTLTTATRVAFNVSTASVTDNTGTFGVEHRHYRDAEHYSDWAALTLDSTPTLADTNAQILVDVDVPPGQVRLTFVAAGGTPDGTADVWVTGAEA